ncbi:MAG: discoidin domain-containing protein [Phycisphaerales bacterium]
MCRRSVCSFIVVSLLALVAGQAQGSPYDRVAYWDGSSGTAWAGDGIAVRDALAAAGYTVLNATELKTWMDARISDGRLSVVVMCRDVVPTSVAESIDANCTIRRYLNAGGKVVWYSDWPFYYVGTTSNSPAGNGAVQILGFNASSGPNDQNQLVTITEAGYQWGLTTPWSSLRPTSPTITDNLTVLATDNNGSAAGWVKHYVPGDTFRGFVRIDDHSGAPINIPQLIAVAEYYEAFVTAITPVPESGATDIPRDVILGWTAGETAATHDVYFGTSFDDVNDASTSDPRGVLASQGQTDTTYDPEGLLEYGQTYYWRVDEVNGAPDYTLFKGEVWSFTAEPYAYPITSLTVAASSEQPASLAIRTIDGSGLDEFDQHGVDLKTMWATPGGLPAWIQYTFDKEYKLHELWVWNANSELESFMGFGAKDVLIEYSSDGETWAQLENVPQFAQGTARPTYTANTIVDLGEVMARHVRLTINAGWGTVSTIVSLSEVRFFYTPAQAFEPDPVDGAAEVDLGTTLNWRPGREATSHEVYFGADATAVAEGTVAAETVTDNSYTPSAMEFGTLYYWKVDEVGDAGTYAGDVWSFTAQEFAPVDDFESYNDDMDAGTTIWHAWMDGVTTKASGSQVGYTDAPFAELAIVHGGKQSMPLMYNNAGDFFFSEAEREFDPIQNWTGNGATEVCIWTRGYPAMATVAVTETGGKMDVTGSGADIWNNSDEFTYAYKTLSGDGALVARVVSVGTGTQTWAKGGVMIRDSLNGGSTHAMMAMTTPGVNGASFQYRPATDGTSTSVDNSGTAVAAPSWVKIERVGDTLTGSVSTDGKAWRQIGQTAIAMTNPVYIGLCVTSHLAGENRTFQFDSIAGTGTITGAWQGAVIDSPQFNAAANMHLSIADSAGKSATITSDTAVTAATWTRWAIPMSDFAGVNFAKVKKMVITIGDKTATTAGGTGIVFIDDIGFGRSAE